MSSNWPYPWQQETLDELARVYAQDRFPHALLIQSRSYLTNDLKAIAVEHRGCQITTVEHYDFANRLARFLLCDEVAHQKFLCSQPLCKSCQLFEAGTHPDFIHVSLETNGKKTASEIKVDQIRQLNHHLGMKSQRGGYRVILLYPADSMNVNAANSLLKGLEEPGEKTCLLLVTNQPTRLPVTIRSRCVNIILPAPTDTELDQWAAAHLDKPVQAAISFNSTTLLNQAAQEQWDALYQQFKSDWFTVAQLKINPVSVAANWQAKAPEMTFNWVHDWLLTLVKHQQLTPDAVSVEQQIASQLPPQGLFEMVDKVLIAKLQFATAVNKQLLFENLLLDWSRLNANARRLKA